MVGQKIGDSEYVYIEHYGFRTIHAGKDIGHLLLIRKKNWLNIFLEKFYPSKNANKIIIRSDQEELITKLSNDNNMKQNILALFDMGIYQIRCYVFG